MVIYRVDSSGDESLVELFYYKSAKESTARYHINRVVDDVN